MAILAPQIVDDVVIPSRLNLGSGSVVSMFYQFAKHDPYPTVLVCGITPDNLLQGFNLHYMTFPVYRALLNRWAGNPMFNYYLMKNEGLIKQSFRSYKFTGIKRMKRVNWRAIVTFLSIIRNYSPQEIQLIKDAVDAQVASRQPELLNAIFGKLAENHI